MDSIKAVIIDDEAGARESLKNLLRDYCPRVELIGTAKNMNEGLKILAKLKPELVFLDIQMPHGSGFDLLERIHRMDFSLIFTTAYQQYAIRAIKFSALDYLLKPIGIEELKTGVAKAISQLGDRRDDERLKILMQELGTAKSEQSKIVIPFMNGFRVLSVRDIVRCEADVNYAIIHLTNGDKVTSSRTLKEYDDLLSPHDFFRVHQSHLINLKFVDTYMRGKQAKVLLQNGDEVPVARSRKETFVDRFLS